MTSEDVVVTKFDLNSKEQTLKSRFLANQRPPPSVLPANTVPVSRVPDPQLETFMRDMAESIRQQPTGSIAAELLKKQANMMQQQIDLLRENQQTNQAMLLNIGKPRDTRRETAELIAPVMEVVREIKSMYKETKQSADLLNIQVEQLRSEFKTRPSAPQESLPTVQHSLDKFTTRKAQLEAKIAEGQRLIDTATVNDGGISTALEGLAYLRSQIQSLPQEFDSFEKDVQARFLRMIEITQKAKALPKDILYPSPDLETARETLMKRLGGVFDYGAYLRELDDLKDQRNALSLEFKQSAPMYPLIPRPQVQVEPVKQSNKKTQGAQRTMKPAPVPQVQTRKTMTKKPAGFSDLISDPLRPPPAVTKKTVSREKSPRQVGWESGKPAMVSQEIQAEISEKKQPPPRPLSPPESTLKPEPEPVLEPPKPSSPQPFELAEPASKKRIQPEDLLPSVYKPTVRPMSQQETTTPPVKTWEKQTLDVLTEYVLAHRLQLTSPRVPSFPSFSRWLGPDQLNTLIKEGLFIDSATIDRLGLEVFDDKIGQIKLEIAHKNGKEESYGDDFEEDIISEHSDKDLEIPVDEPYKGQQVSPPEPNTDHLYVTFPEISPITEEKRPENRESTDITSLLSPDILSKMSPSAVKQYLLSLIQSGHIGPNTENSYIPPPLPVQIPPPQPVLLPVSEENKEEEIERILGKDTAKLLVTVIKEKQQDIITKFARSFDGEGEREREGKQRERQEVKREIVEEEKKEEVGKIEEKSVQISTDFKEAFSIPKRLNLDLDAEEAKLRLEQDLPRLMLKLPPFRPAEIPAPDSNMSLYLSASESSIGGYSVGSELFSMENTEYMGSLAQFMKGGKRMEEGQLPGNPELSEGELAGGDDGLSSGEIPPDVLNPDPPFDFPRPRINIAEILSSDAALDEVSEGEFDPEHLFHP